MHVHRRIVFGVLFATRATIAYQFQSVASVGPLLIDNLSIGFATLGALIGCYMFPGVVLALPGGLLAQRFGAKRTLLFGLLLMTAGGLITAAASGVPLLFGGRLVTGAGAALLNVVLARSMAIWFAKDELPLVMGAFVASWPLGVALSLVTHPALALTFGWAPALATASAPCLVCAFALAVAYRDPSPEPPESSRPIFDLSRDEFLLAAIAGGIWGFYNAAYIILVASVPDFLVQRDWSLVEASYFTSVFGWALIVSLPLGGYVSQRFNCSNALMSSCFVFVALAAAALALSSATTASLTALLLLIGLPAGAIMAILPKQLAGHKLSNGMGVFFTVFYVVIAVLPGGAGVARGLSNSTESSIAFAAGTIMVAFLLLLMIVRRETAAVLSIGSEGKDRDPPADLRSR